MTEQALLLHQLEGRERRLEMLQGHGSDRKGELVPAPSATEREGSVSDVRSEGPSATSAEVEDLRKEVERLRTMLVDSSAPPRYEA